MNRNLAYILAGAALVAGGIVLLSRIGNLREEANDPIEEAQRMLSRAQGKITEIEAGFRAARHSQPAQILIG